MTFPSQWHGFGKDYCHEFCNSINYLYHPKKTNMEYQRMEKKKMTWTIALVMVSLIAVTGFIVAYAQYDQKKDYMAEATDALNSQEKRVMESYDRIESNLAKITQYEEMIKGNMTDAESNSSLSPEERIQNEINMIEQLISENNNIIADLNSQIKEKDSRLANYSKTVKDLQARVVEYKANVDVLVAEKEALQKNLDETTLAKKNLEGEVVILGTEVAQKSNTIEEQSALLIEKERNLHTAYYTVGTYKSLRDQNIVEKDGGFLGINREKNLSNGLDNNKFQEIDTRNVTEIPVDAKRCEIITNQDPSAYSLVYENDKVSKIKITDPAKFWGKTQYLVVVVRESNFDETADSR
jgi:flagellar biosynthesis chaperone FliJ